MDHFARAILDALPEQVCVLNPEGRIAAVNRSWLSFGDENTPPAGVPTLPDGTPTHPVGEHALRGTNYLDICGCAQGPYCEGAEEVAAGIRALLAGTIDHFSHEYPCPSPTEERWFRAKMSRFPIEGQNHIVVIHENVTDRVLSVRQLAESQERFRAIIQNAPIGMALISLDGRFLDSNQSLSRITGYTKQELEELTFQEITHPEDLESGLTQLQRLLEGSRDTVQIEKRYVKKDAQCVWVQITTSLQRDGERRPLCYIAQIEDVSEKRENQAKIERLAHYDPLTGLPNRRLLLDRLHQAVAQASRHGRAISLLFLDLDGFKDVNDAFGHAVGDEVLKAVAERLTDCVRKGDTVARLGGDEFIVVLPEVRTRANAALVAEKILRAMNAPLEKIAAAIGTSIGIALLPTGGTNDAESLMKQADTAMYAAKEAGRGRYCFFQ